MVLQYPCENVIWGIWNWVIMRDWSRICGLYLRVSFKVPCVIYCSDMSYINYHNFCIPVGVFLFSKSQSPVQCGMATWSVMHMVKKLRNGKRKFFYYITENDINRAFAFENDYFLWIQFDPFSAEPLYPLLFFWILFGYIYAWDYGPDKSIFFWNY